MRMPSTTMAGGITWRPRTNWLLLLLFGGSVILAGLLAPVLGSFLGAGSAQKILIALTAVAVITIAGIVTITRAEPVRFAFLALLVFLPFVAMPVPPGRLQLTLFDVAMVLITFAVVLKQTFTPTEQRSSLFPARSAQIAMLLLLPAVLFSGFPVLSVWTFFEIFAIYVFFLLVFRELEHADGLRRIAVVLAVSILVVAVGIFIERVLKVNLSLRSANSNLVTQLAGLEIRRGAGFFQDPQKAAQFLGCGIAFLLLLAVRRRFANDRVRWLLWTAVIVGAAGMVATISRGALIATFAVGGGFALVCSRWSVPAKLAALTGLLLLFTSAYLLTPADMWLRLAPTGLAERLATLDSSVDHRLYLWFLAKDAFTNYPITGVGLGGFGPYLFKTRATSLLFTGGVTTPLMYIVGQPESGYLKIVYEGGVVASLALLLVIGDVARRIAGTLFSRFATYDARTDLLAAAAGLLVFAATFVTLFTLSDERNAAVLAILLAVVCWRTSGRVASIGLGAPSKGEGVPPR